MPGHLPAIRPSRLKCRRGKRNVWELRNVQHFRSIVEAPSFKRTLDGGLEGEQLQRVPRGFPREHEAAAYLRYRQFLAGKEFPAGFATSPKFYSSMLGVYRTIAPLIRFLNEPLQ